MKTLFICHEEAHQNRELHGQLRDIVTARCKMLLQKYFCDSATRHLCIAPRHLPGTQKFAWLLLGLSKRRPAQCWYDPPSNE